MKKIILVLLTVCLVFSMISCNSEKEPEPEEQVKNIVLFGGDEDYRIVYSSNATLALREMMVDISTNVKKVTGSEPKCIVDDSKKDTEVAREILIATTNRTQSEEGMKKLTGTDYRVEFIGEKLVITASNDAVLKKAVEKLLSTWTALDGKVMLPETTLLSEDLSEAIIPLYVDSEFRYRIIVQDNVKGGVYDEAKKLSTRLFTLTEKSVEVYYDSEIADTADAYEICIGKTGRAISDSIYGELESTFDYKIKADGNKIAIGAKSVTTLIKAMYAFEDDIINTISGTYSGIPAIANNYLSEGTTVVTVPESEAGTLKKTVRTGDNDEYVYYYEGTTEADYNNYVEFLKDEGCSVTNTYTMGNNKYTLMNNSDYNVYVGYLSKVGSMRVVLDKASDIYPSPAVPTSSNVCTPTLWQLKLDTVAAQANGGMSYVIQLTDGTFVVVDGGYRTDAEALYEHLKANTKGGGKPVISAWIITHLHNDHYGALKGITSNYKDSVEVKAFYYNFPGMKCGDIDGKNADDVEGVMKQWQNATRYGKLHSGMTFSVADAKFTVICTYEDVFPLTIENGNDTSTVLKVEVGGQSIMLLGDAYYNQSTTMVNQVDASVLKSDIVQISHHGYEGCSASLYAAVNASVALWPMPIVGFANNAVFKEWYEGGKNTYIRTSTDVKKIIISGAGTEKLELPYTPTGDRIIDYNAFYNANKND